MPFGSEGVEPGIGLALSGGGFRATLFHLGSLWRLNELGFLAKLERISSVSGGSITAACLAVNWRRFQWSSGVVQALLTDLRTRVRKGAYWGVRTEIRAYGLGDAMAVPPATTHALAEVRTRLNAFSEEEQGELINWGYAVCDAAMRRHVLTEAVSLPHWPMPAFALTR